MKIKLFLGGRRPPRPARGGGRGETRFPHTLAPAAYFHVSPPRGSAAQRRNENKVILGRAQPFQTLPRVEEWGNPVSPFPCPSSLFSR